MKFLLPLVFIFFCYAGFSQNSYAWNDHLSEENFLQNRVSVPNGYERMEYPLGSFENWLQNLPLLEGKPDVILYNGDKKRNQFAHYAVINLDVGSKDLQQCADAVMRMRAEYLFQAENFNEIAFSFTSGDLCAFKNWAIGYRPIINGNNVTFKKIADVDYSYSNFMKYMEVIFSYCGTASLSKELNKLSDLKDIKPGDVFIIGGHPGHAVLIVDVAIHRSTGKKIFMLAQSYMPAQQMHILNNLSNNRLNPWYSINFGTNLVTPEYTFSKEHLMRF